MQNWPTIFTVLAAAILPGACVSAELSGGQSLPAPAEIEARLFDEQNVLILLDSDQEANELVVNVSRRGYQLNERQTLNGLGLILLDFERPLGVSDEVAINDMRAMSPAATVGLDDIYRAQGYENGAPIAGDKAYANELLGWPSDGCVAQTSVGLIDGYLAPSALGTKDDQIVSTSFVAGEAAASDHAEMVARLIVGPGRLAEARLYSAAVVGKTENGQTGSGTKALLLALNWMRVQGVQVVNVSLSGPHNPLLERVVNLVSDDGMIVVAAVGNEGPQAPARYPAAFDNVIGVTAIDVEREVFEGAIQGRSVEYSAPGVEVLVPMGNQGYRFATGTSFAAPFVTAMIAADASHSFKGNTPRVRSFLDKNVDDLGQRGRDPVFGKGLVRADLGCAI